MRIAMIGTGYVGLVSAACFAEFGVEVVAVDNNQSKIDCLLKGSIPIYEPGLDDMVARHAAAGRLNFTTDMKQAVQNVDAVFIAVGTPSRRGDGHADLTYLFAAAEEIAHSLTGDAVVVTKSTVPVGTGRRLQQLFAKLRPDLSIEVASNPEFLREGSAIEDFLRPDRVVVGVESAHARRVLDRLYRPLNLIADADHVHHDRDRRADQVRHQQLSRDQGHLHQRDRGPVREGRRRRPGGGAGAGPRPADRQQVPAPGTGLRRLLLPQGHRRAAAHRRGGQCAAAHRRERGRGQRGPQAQHGAPHRPGLRRLGARPDPGDPGRDLQAQHRRHPRQPGAGHRPGAAGRRCGDPGLRSGGHDGCRCASCPA